MEIREHQPGRDLDDFLGVAKEVFRGDSNYVAPLNMEITDRLSPKKNPFFQHGEVGLFTAWKGGRAVGRISAQIDREHLRIHKDDVGFFGFFDCLEDVEVARKLVDTAEGWLKRRGMRRMRGPFSLSINEEAGLLIEGFDTPPAMMMAHSRPYQGALAEAAGLEKVKDLLAWSYDVREVPSRAEKAWQQMQALPEVTFRSVNKKNMDHEVKVLLEIFNDAWKENWGFVPLTDAEARKTAQDMKLILDEDIAFFVEIKGRPMAMVVCMPNLNEAIRDLDGKLFPTGLFKVLWRTKVKHPRTARLILLGIRQELRGVKRYGALSTAMYAEVAKRGLKKGYDWCELSWTLEDNRPINLGIRAMGAKVYKKYRVYEKAISE